MLQRAASNAYSWWWASHIRTKQSKWLDSNLQEMDGRVKTMLKIIDEDADSFAKRAEMYFKRRPELTSFVEEAYRAYRALAERYDHISGELHKANHTLATAFPEQVQYAMLEEEDENFPKAITPIDPRKIHKPTVDSLMCKRRGESQPPLKKSQRRTGISFSRDKAQEEINKLQKVILVLQTEKEFIKSSFESRMAKYWEIEKKIIEMQEDVYCLEAEFNASAVIEDDEARALMTATALKSCEDAIFRLHEQKNKSKERERMDFNRIKASREKLKALIEESGQFPIDITEISNRNAERNCNIANNEEVCSFNKDRIELQSLCEKVKAYLEQNPDTTVEEIAESIDVLVNRTTILELTVTKQSAQFDILSSEINELEKYLQSLEDEKMILINDSKELSNKLQKAKEQFIIVENLEENIKYEEINLRKDLYEAYSSFADVSEKLQAISHEANGHITSDSKEDEIPSINEVTEGQNTEAPKIHGVKVDSVEEIRVAQEFDHLVKEHRHVAADLSKDSIDVIHVAQELGQSITDHSQLDADLERDSIDKIHAAQELGQSVTYHSHFDADPEKCSITKIHEAQELGLSVTDNSQSDADWEKGHISKIHVAQEHGQSVRDHSQMDADLEKDSTDKIYVAQELGLSVTGHSKIHVAQELGQSVRDHSQMDADLEKGSTDKIYVAQELGLSVTGHSQLDADLEIDSIDNIHVAQELDQSVTNQSQMDVDLEINSTDRIHVARELSQSITEHSQLDAELVKDSIDKIHVAKSVTNQSQLDVDLEINSIHVAKELGQSNTDHSQLDAVFKISSNAASENSSVFMQEDSSHPHVCIHANTIKNEETLLEKKENSTGLHQLLLSTLEGREKILLAEYTSILRNYKETKKKLLEVEQKNENYQNEMMTLIRELKDANSTKDEEILLLKQHLASSKLIQEDNVGFPAEAKEHCNGHQKPRRRSSLSTLVVEDLNPQCSQVTEDTNISSTMENDTINAVTETECLLPQDIYLHHIDELNSTSVAEEKFRREMDKLLEENLEFWLRFSASFHHIQELQTKFEELQTDRKKMDNTAIKEGTSGLLRDQIPEPDSASTVTQLRALKTELQVWLEQSKFLQDELQIRLSSLCSIQEEITGAAKESLLSEDFQLTPYQAAKFQGEVFNMKQENNNVEKELHVGIDHVRRLQVGVDRALAKLHAHLVLSGLRNSHTDPLKSSPAGARIPLRSFLFGAKPKKHSLFACVNPALQRHYSNVRQGSR